MGTFQGHRRIHHPDGSNDESWAPVRCAHCLHQVSAAIISRTPDFSVHWLQCTICGQCLVKNGLTISPAVPPGPWIEGLPDNVAAAYNEARLALGVGAVSAAELVCRQILLHVAVQKGAASGVSFSQAIDHLAREGYVTPPMRPWVDAIRRHGNEVTHDLVRPSTDRAESTLMFTAELLRLIYEMAHMAHQYQPAADAGSPPPAEA